ncbi:MAG TPA: hypothetical protein VJV78_00240 [Polyangiales bacterium]|nr:hypothetical protein [Polyangiales bacterium]
MAGGDARLLTSETGTLALLGTNLIIAIPSSEKPEQGKIVSVPTDGGAMTTIVSNQSGPHIPLSCGADLCWLTAVKSQAVIGGKGALVRYTAGGMPKTIIEDNGVYFIRQLMFDGTDFFGAMFQNLGVHEGTPFRLAAAGGKWTSLVMDGGSIALDEKCVYMASSVTGITTIAK